MSRYNNLIKRLSEVPEPSEKIYNKIEQKIDSLILLKRTILSIAAALILTAGVFSVFEINKYRQAEISREDRMKEAVSSELEYVADYLNGNTIEEEINLYSVNTIVQNEY